MIIDEYAEENPDGSGELAADDLDLLLCLFAVENELLPISFLALALALALAFSTTALLSSRKTKSTIFR